MADEKRKQVLVDNLKTALPNWKLVRDTESDEHGEWWYCLRSARDDEAAGTMTEGATALEALLEAAACEFKAFTPNKGLTREEIAEQETRDFCLQHGLPFPVSEQLAQAQRLDADALRTLEEEDEDDPGLPLVPDFLCIEVMGLKNSDPVGLRFRNKMQLPVEEIDDRVKLACIDAAKNLLRRNGYQNVKIVPFGLDAYVVGSVDIYHLED